MRIQNNTQNCEARKSHLGDETSPILPMPPILVPFAIVSRDAMGEGVGSRPHDGPRPPPVRSSTAVSIQMTDDLLEELSKDVSPLASLVFHSARKQPRPRRITALLTSRWSNGSAALDSPGRAVVCGWGSHSCSWASVSSNLAGWDGCCSRANDFRFHQSLSIYYCQKPLSAPVGSCLIVFTSRMREEPVAAYKASHLNDELAVASASSWR